jgi:phosphopantothenoylcysteine decarboxylase/phosphopantothenate--cysteine ligase
MSAYKENSPRILLLVSGSIAAFKAVALCSKLTQAGFQVEVALSDSAKEFVGAASFEGFTRKKVHEGNFEAGNMMAHIDLERSADFILNYPSTATTISSFVHGDGSSLLGAIFLAHEFKKPFWIAPAMNQAMIAHPATDANLNQLEAWGARVLLGESGNLACGETGAGRLMEPETILAEIQNYFVRKKNPKKILITAGGTSEKIDPVRSITNFSTGETGFRAAKFLQTLGHDVTLIQSKRSNYLNGIEKLVTYDTTAEFADAFAAQLKNESFDLLIHSAAVSDYGVATVTDSHGKAVSTAAKIQSNESLTLTLKPNPKYIQQARELSRNKKLKIISFKLTSGENDLKLGSYDSEYIFHNELSGVSREKHLGTWYARNAAGQYDALQSIQTKTELLKLISEGLDA